MLLLSSNLAASSFQFILKQDQDLHLLVLELAMSTAAIFSAAAAPRWP